MNTNIISEMTRTNAALNAQIAIHEHILAQLRWKQQQMQFAVILHNLGNLNNMSMTNQNENRESIVKSNENDEPEIKIEEIKNEELPIQQNRIKLIRKYKKIPKVKLVGKTTNIGKNHFTNANRFIKKNIALLINNDQTLKVQMNKLTNHYKTKVKSYSIISVFTIWRSKFITKNELYSEIFVNPKEAQMLMESLTPEVFQIYLKGIKLYFKRGVENYAHHTKIRKASKAMISTGKHYLRALNNGTDITENIVLLSSNLNKK